MPVDTCMMRKSWGIQVPNPCLPLSLMAVTGGKDVDERDRLLFKNQKRLKTFKKG